MKHCAKCNSLMPEDAKRCIRCGFESQETKGTAAPKSATSAPLAPKPEQPVPRNPSRAGWPLWWSMLILAAILLFASQYVVRLLPSARLPLLGVFGAALVAGVTALVIGVIGTARSSKVKAAVLGILAAIPQLTIVALLGFALFVQQRSGSGGYEDCGSEPVSLKGEPPSAAAFYRRAKAVHDNFNGNTAQLCAARAHLREALILDPSHAPSFVEAAWVEARLGYESGQSWQPEALARSRMLIEQALKLDPRSLDAWIEAGYGSVRQRDFEGARQRAAEAEKVSPGAPEIRLLSATIARREGNMKDAVALAKDALPGLQSRNQKVSVYEILTDAYQKWEDYDAADQAYRDIIDLDPGSPWSNGNYAAFLVNTGRNYDRAIQYAETALQKMDYPAARFTLSQAYYGKASAYIEHEEFDKAEPLLRESLKYLPSNANAHYALGLCYDSRGETGKAEEAMRTALKYQPNHAAARDALQQILSGK